MTQDEAVTLMQRLLFCAQKLRSNAKEAVANERWSEETEKKVLADIMPSLFAEGSSKINLVEALTVYANKAELNGFVEPIDMYNALTLCHRESAFEAVYALIGENTDDLPDPMKALTELMSG